MCAKNHLVIFCSYLDIWENVEWPRFLDHPVHFTVTLRVCCIVSEILSAEVDKCQRRFQAFHIIAASYRWFHSTDKIWCSSIRLWRSPLQFLNC